MRTIAKTSAFCLSLLAGTFHGSSQTNLITFDDGIHGQSISNFYASRGVVIENAIWSTNRDARGQPFAGASGSFIIFSENSGSSPSKSFPIVARFTQPMSFVAISATDIGTAGARLDAYDAEAGGNLVGHAEAYGDGVGFDIYRELEVSHAGIRRVEMYQPAPNGSDGVAWDNLRFTPPPPPLISGISVYAGLRLEAAAGSQIRIERSSDVSGSNWTTLTNIVMPSPAYLFIDQSAPATATRFYRAATQ